MNDQKDEGEKVQEYRRQHLEPEIAAMSVSVDDQDENPTLIVNIDDPSAKSAIRKVITWLGIIGGGIFTWSRRAAKEQMALAMAGTATIATVTTAAVTTITRDDADTGRPHIATERVVTLQPGPPVTVTASPKPSKTPPRSESPPPDPAPGREQPARPKRSERPAPRSTRTPAPALRPTHSAKQSTHAPSTGEAHSPAGDAADLPAARVSVSVPPVEAEVAVAKASGCGGTVEVDADPLLDLCLLG